MKIVISLLMLLSGCSQSTPLSPEDRVKATLEQIEAAAEQRSITDFMQHFSDSYADHRGNSRDDIRRIIQMQYLHNQNIHILSKLQSLSIEGDTALVEISAVMAATEAGLSGESQRLKADTHRFSVVLRATEDQQNWLIESVSRERGWEP